MTTPIVFPDVELWATAYLRAALADYGYPGMYVGNTRGTATPAVWVRRDGGPERDKVLEVPRLGINVFHTTEQKVGDLARTVSALLRAAADGKPVTRVFQTSGPSSIADASGQRRFLTFEMTVRGADLAPDES